MRVSKKIIYMFMLSQLLMCSHSLIGKEHPRNKEGLRTDDAVGMYPGKYEGEELNGKAHGKGKVTSDRGDVFEGTFIKGVGEGFFIVKYIEGDRFCLASNNLNILKIN